MRYSLIGGGGSVGQELVPILQEHGHSVRVLGRDETKLHKIFGQGVQCVGVDMYNQSQLQDALKESDIIVYLVGVPYNQFDLHPKLMKEALSAARSVDVPYFIHVSTVYPYGPPQTPTVNESHPREPNTFKGRMRKEQENLVLQAHNPNGMKCMIVRPSDFYGPTAENSFVRDIFVGALENRRAKVIAPVNTPHDLIFLPDLARAIFKLSERPSSFGQVYNITGFEPITTQDFADKVYGQVGQPAKLTEAGPLMLRILGWFNPFLGEVVEMHYLWKTPVLLDDTKLQTALPEFRKTPHTEAIKLTLAGVSKSLPSKK